ncbi:unnamed protein product, partial [Heterotrigona itama]
MDEQNASTSFSFQHVCNVKFPCPNCSSVFNRKNNLQKHLKYECGQLPRFKCPYCEYCSKKTSNVRAHIRSIHSGYTVYVIDLKSSYISTIFKTDIFLYLVEIKFFLYSNAYIVRTWKKKKGDFGHDRVSSFDLLIITIVTVSVVINYPIPSSENPAHGYRYLKVFKASINDLEHLGGFKIPPYTVVSRPTVFLDRNKDRFPCPKCTSTFNRKNNLYSHIKFECGQLPRFGCPYCDYASKKSSNIRAHVRRKHHGCNVNVINVSRNTTYGTTTEDENSGKIEQII